MNVKLAVVLALACLFLAGVCFAKDNNECDNDKEFDVTDKFYKNGRVVVTWGKHGGKIRVHSAFAPRKWVQIAHVKVQELTKNRAPVYLKNPKGKSTGQLRGVNLANTDFTWSTPTVVDGAEGRTVDTYMRTQFPVAGVSVKVIFRVNLVQESSVQVVNGVTLRREVDDVQFSLDIVDWPFEAESNILDWSFYVKTNYDPVDKKLDGTLTKSKLLRVNGVPGTGVYIFKNAVINYPNTAQVDGAPTPCVSEVTDIDNKGNYNLDVYFPKAAHHLFYNAVVKLINVPSSEGDPNHGGGTGCPAGQTCTPPDSNACNVSPAPCGDHGTCTPGATGLPQCTCKDGYTGSKCDQAPTPPPPDPCSPNPCHNGGTCNAGSCTCVNGFTGPTCDNAPDPCLSFACNNGGLCTSDASGAKCTCANNYVGDHCDTPCPCQNGGVCVGKTTACSCPIAYDGATCQTKNFCVPNPCLNGGVCSRATASDGSFTSGGTCACTVAWQGPTCATPSPVNSLFGLAVDSAVDYALQAPNPTPYGGSPGTPNFGMFTTKDGKVLCILYPQYATMRLYNVAEEFTNVRNLLQGNHFYPAGVELDRTIVEFIDNADFVQITQGQLIETSFGILGDPNFPFIETAKTYELDGGTWEYDETGSSADHKHFTYWRSATSEDNVPVNVDIQVNYYTDQAQVDLVGADGSGSNGIKINVGAGALKFTMHIGPWPWTDNLDVNGYPAYLKWTSFIQTRSDFLPSDEQALPSGEKRFKVTGGAYDAHPEAVKCDGQDYCAAGPVVIEQELDTDAHNTKIVHYLPSYTSDIWFDPVLQLPKEGEPDYPPWVDAHPGGASVIRDPRSQFSGAATLHTSVVAIAFAAIAALFMSRV